LIDEVARPRSIDPGQDAWIGSAVEDPVGSRKRVKERAVAHIADADVNSQRSERFNIRLAAASAEVVKAGDAEPGGQLEDMPGNGRARKPANAGY
jgi:hypothetical protein